jgi:hypothetical protein
MPSTASSMVARLDSCRPGRGGVSGAWVVLQLLTLSVLSHSALEEHNWGCHTRSASLTHSILTRPETGRTARACRAAWGVSTMLTQGFVRMYAPSRASQSCMSGELDGSCGCEQEEGEKHQRRIGEGVAGALSALAGSLGAVKGTAGAGWGRGRGCGAHSEGGTPCGVSRQRGGPPAGEGTPRCVRVSTAAKVPGAHPRHHVRSSPSPRTCSSRGLCGSTGTKRRPRSLRGAGSRGVSRGTQGDQEARRRARTRVQRQPRAWRAAESQPSTGCAASCRSAGSPRRQRGALPARRCCLATLPPPRAPGAPCRPSTPRRAAVSPPRLTSARGAHWLWRQRVTRRLSARNVERRCRGCQAGSAQQAAVVTAD